MNMLAVGVEGDIGAEGLSGAADITFSVSIEAEAISVLLVLVLTALLISDTVLSSHYSLSLRKTTFIFISTERIRAEPVNFSAIKNNQ